jgi:CHAT domain-containing protein
MFSHFEFADGPVFAIDIARSRLNAQVAVLAGCETGRIQLAFPDEPDGLVRAFLARGASSVVAGLWPLDDEAACVTTVAAAEALAVGRSVRESLSVGRAACRSKFDHPYFWGALSLFGGYEDAP